MKRAVIIAIGAALVAVTATTTFAQQPRGNGFQQIVCVLGVNGSGTYEHGGLTVTVVDHGIFDVANHIGSATVTITHGASGGDGDEFAYRDNNQNGKVDCGDDVLGKI